MSIGLDIGSTSIKVVELSKRGNDYMLKSAGAVGYSGPEIDANFTDEKAIANMVAVIKKLFKDAKISSKDVSISLPETQVFTRILPFPMLNDQEIASAVKWEAEEYIPIPLKDAIMEHQIIDRREDTKPPQVLVLLVASLRSLVEKYVEILEKADLNVVSVETELMSMVRCLAPVDKSALLIDFGAKSTNIAVSNNGQLYFTRSIPTAGAAFTRAVSQALGANAAQAEEYKKTYGLDERQLEGKVGKALLPIIKVVSQEIKKAIHYYQLNLKGNSPSTVIISGGSAGMPGLAPALTNLLGLEVTVGSPFSKIQVDPTAAQSLANYAPLYSVAVGLALRNE